MTSYHAWTHRPKAQGGTDPIESGALVIPFFRAYQWDISQTFADNSEAFLRFDKWQSSDTAVMENATPVAGTPDYIEQVNCKERGLYLINATIDMTPWGTAGGQIGLSVEDAGSTFLDPPMQIQPSSMKAGDSSTGIWSFAFILSFPPIWLDETTDTLAPDLPEMLFHFRNESNASISTLTGTMVEIHRLYAFDYETVAVQSQA